MLVTSPSLDNTTMLLSINAVVQLPLKLTSLNYPSWFAQFNSQLLGYDLIGYVQETLLCLSNTIFIDGKITAKISYSHWVCCDKLSLHAVISSTLESIVPLIVFAKTVMRF